MDLLIKYSRYLHRLCEIERVGWKQSGIERGETVSEHSFEVAIYSLILSISIDNEELDIGRILVYSLLHDMAEAITGDIPRPKKESGDIEREKMILLNMVEELGLDKILGRKNILSDTLEMRIVHLSDNIATLLKGIYYYKKGYNTLYLREIIRSTWKEAYDNAREIRKSSITNFLEKLRDAHKELFM